MSILLVNGNAKQLPLADKSVHTAICSPPYWGLRDYNIGKDKGEIGQEERLGEYIETMVGVFREVKRVLRDDGSIWVNIGDTYATKRNGRSAEKTKLAGNDDRTFRDKPFSTVVDGLKEKDMCGVPWRLAFAMQDDGWYLRSDCIWNKTNPMPSSIKDRPALCHEYMFLFSKKPRYYYDIYGVREGLSAETTPRLFRGVGEDNKNIDGAPGQSRQSLAKPRKKGDGYGNVYEDRNLRTVWTLATYAYSGSHFATYPPSLVERPIKLSTSKVGVCPKCGKQFVRVTGKGGEVKSYGIARKRADAPGSAVSRTSVFRTGKIETVKTLGWLPGCDCYGDREGMTPDDYKNMERKPAVVLDPFNGSGTTGLVSVQLGRNYIGVDLSMEYIYQARKRLSLDAVYEWEHGIQTDKNDTFEDLPLFGLLKGVAE